MIPKGFKLPQHVDLLPVNDEKGMFQAVFSYPEGVSVVARLIFDEKQTGAQMVITKMLTEPSCRRCEGFGTRTILCLTQTAIEAGLLYLKATTTNADAQKFLATVGYLPDDGGSEFFTYHHAAMK